MAKPIINFTTVEPTKKRGRKLGSSLYPKDQELLMTAARGLNTGRYTSPNNAFTRITNDDETAIRRLNRRWQKEGALLLELDRKAHLERCELEYRSLRHNQPVLWSRIVEFMATPAGKRHLKQYERADGMPVHPMALGLMNLFEAIELAEQSSKQVVHPQQTIEKNDKSQSVQRRFDKVVDAWLDDGTAATSDNLRELSRRIDALADRLDEYDEEEGQS